MSVDFRAQCAVWTDSIAPTDACVINPTFKATGLTLDAQQIANDLVTEIKAMAPATAQVVVKLYDLHGTKPIYPMALGSSNLGGAPASTTNREIALCLSFYASQNQPRRRGRLYVPYHWITTGSTVGPRPTTPNQTAVSGLAARLAGIGGVDIDWTVWSKRDATSHPVTDWWVDNEWDVVRSRGLRSTARIKGTVSEATAPNLVYLTSARNVDPLPELEEPMAVAGDTA